jgi:hypothetical protein
MRLVQLSNAGRRRVAAVEEPRLRLLDAESVYSLADSAIRAGVKLSEMVEKASTQERLDYDTIYDGSSEWKWLSPIDHPEPSRCLISGTGLTHLGSARDRQAMHAKALTSQELEDLTDSMKMFRWGVESGRPDAGCIGVPPEWFYKGNGSILRSHGEALHVPSFAEDGGEEAELASIYIIGPDGQPFRIGMAVGNEFSDHCFEKKNYLNLAASKLRNCAIGPELVLDPEFESVSGQVKIERGGRLLWKKEIHSGEAHMCHSLQNLEHHHFKFEQHRQPGDVHVHFLGADCLSFGEGLRLADGDVVEITFQGFGRALRNRVHVDRAANELISVISLG